MDGPLHIPHIRSNLALNNNKVFEASLGLKSPGSHTSLLQPQGIQVITMGTNMGVMEGQVRKERRREEVERGREEVER